MLKKVCAYLKQNRELSEKAIGEYLSSQNLTSKERKAVLMAFDSDRGFSANNNSW
jgi:hypothetical protein